MDIAKQSRRRRVKAHAQRAYIAMIRRAVIAYADAVGGQTEAVHISNMVTPLACMIHALLAPMYPDPDECAATVGALVHDIATAGNGEKRVLQ